MGSTQDLDIPSTSNNITVTGNTYNATVSLSAGVTVITHSMGKTPRFVEFLDSNKIMLTCPWQLHTGDTTNKIDVTSGDALTGVTVNIIFY